MRQDNEITSRIPRQELAGLLDTMAPRTAQRITAEFPIAEVVVRFTTPASNVEAAPTMRVAERPRLPSWVIVAVSFGITLLLAGLVWGVAT